MDELLEQFLLESRELIVQSSRDFATLGLRADDADAIDSAFRAIHTLKGSVAIFAMVPAERVLHSAETILEHVKASGGAVESGQLTALAACLDQIDRWIDDMEIAGTLPADAESVADRLSSSLADTPFSSAAAAADADAGDADWAVASAARFFESSNAVATPVTVFRYVPATDCFFRGEDPLAIASAVPELVSLEILPAGGEWPSLDTFEPFACVSVLEGISNAGAEAVRSAFRLVPDQIAVSVVDPSTSAGLPEVTRGMKSADVLRVPSYRIDAMSEGLGELIVAVNAIAALTTDATLERDLAVRLRTIQGKLEQVTGRLDRGLRAVRAVSLEGTLRRLPRLVREIADNVGKRVTFTIEGAELEVDKQIADGLFEPLLHLLRNAIDHGAETPQAREAAGKPPDCRIALRISRQADSVEICLTDDGAGIDPEQIRDTAVARALIDRADADGLNDAETLRLIFLPGFSTASAVTSVSGRGVGMDAVKAAMEKLQGTVSIDSVVGRGTTFRMRFKAGALTTSLLVVEIGAERYGVAFDQIAETARIADVAIQAVGGGSACVLRGRTVPVVDLSSLIDLTSRHGPLARMLITDATGDRVAVRVDGFGERVEALVRPSAGMLAAVPGVTGSTVMSDGTVMLVLDLPELLA